MNFNSMLLHHLCGDGVVLLGIADNTATGSCRDGSRVSPDQFCTGHPEAFHKLLQVLFVFIGRYLLMVFRVTGVAKVFTVGAHVLQIVKSPVEVNHVPFSVAKPCIDGLQCG